jgi:cyclopropane fatty-acyl-phospholipid synthase-like methyltransferase
MTITKEDIVRYYQECERDYRWIWDLKNSLAMHYGYWDETVQTFPDALQKENEVLATLASVTRESKVLDAGCGVGGSSIFLAKKFDCEVTGISIVSSQVISASENAKRHGVEDRAHFEERDFLATGYKDESFDVVWAIESVCHAANKEQFIKEAFRILRIGGVLVVADGFLSDASPTPQDAKMMNIWLSGWSVPFLETLQNFEKYLRGAGFSEISIKDVGRNVLPSSRRMYLISLPAIVVGNVMRFMGLQSSVQMGSLYSAKYQYKTLRSGLWQYAIVFARKA